MNNETEIRLKVEEILKEEGMELVELKLFSYGANSTVRCLADFASGGITVDDCARLNEKIFSFLDEKKLLGEDFQVEVHSPGLDRPLKSMKDFLRSKNKTVGIWLAEPLEGKTYIEGTIVDTNEQCVFLKTKSNIFKIELTKIKLGKEKIEL